MAIHAPEPARLASNMGALGALDMIIMQPYRLEYVFQWFYASLATSLERHCISGTNSGTTRAQLSIMEEHCQGVQLSQDVNLRNLA
jgi:hypothetical protein